MAWQDAHLKNKDCVPVMIESYQKFLNAYGEAAVVNTLRSLKDTGRPLPICCGLATVKGLVITVRVLSGVSRQMLGCKYNDLASFWEERAADWVSRLMRLDKAFIEVELLFQGKVLYANQTLSEHGIDDGAELVAIVKPDHPLPLADSSDSD